MYDRSPTSHAVNLFDIQSKYADVVTVAAAIAYVSGTRNEKRLRRGRWKPI